MTREGSKREATRHEVAWPEGREPGREAARPNTVTNTGTVDLEKRLESHAFYLECIVSDDIAADVRQALIQLREYRTALEARPAMPEREAIARIIRDMSRGRCEVVAYHKIYAVTEQGALEVADAILALPTTGDVREAAPEREAVRQHVMAGDPEDLSGIALQWYLGFDFGYPHSARESNIAVEAFKDGYRAALASPPSAHDMREALEIADKLDKLHSNQRPLLSAASKALRALASSPMDAVTASDGGRDV